MLNRWKVYKDNICVFSVIVGMFMFPIILSLLEFHK
ncbi:hypothetical protein LISE100100_01040 [Listeria seeligeri]